MIPICLSDMESDDEWSYPINKWITKLEDPCLPEDNSWLDIHECFEEGTSGTKRKSGIIQNFKLSYLTFFQVETTSFQGKLVTCLF